MIELQDNNCYNHTMDEREQRILRAYQDFQHFGIIDNEDELTDPEAASAALAAEVENFEQDVKTGYTDKSQITSRLTRIALHEIIIQGGPDEEIHQYLVDNNLSTRQSPDYRREEAIKAIKEARAKAEKARSTAILESELGLDADDYRSIDDTLSEILRQRGLSKSDQGSMRLLFGLVVLRDDEVSPIHVMQWKSNAAGILRAKLAAIEKDIPSSPRVKEGVGLMHRMLNRTRSGYPTIRSIAETINHDKEARIKATYTDDIEQNQRMIETYLSDVLDIMYAPKDSSSQDSVQ